MGCEIQLTGGYVATVDDEDFSAVSGTKWWHEYAVRGDVHFIKGRIKFGDATAGAPFPSALVVFWPKP